MGEVYLAQHPRLPRNDALKVMPVAVSSDTEYRERFNREAQLASTLWHPNIVAIHDRGEFDGQLWISMDYVEGTDAGCLLQQEYRNGMPPDEVVRIITAVADALDYAHQRQLLHRDVKPANILLAQQDSGGWRALLADFGIARRVDDSSGLTATNMTVGTVAYAAPEQLMGAPLDGRADQYALAATAFHLLTGAPLFQHSNPAVVISQHLTAPPPPIADRVPELSGVGPVLSKALAKSPEERYDTCRQFADALAQEIDTVARDLGVTDETVAAVAAVAKPRHGRAGRKPRWRPAILIPGILVLVIAAVAAAVLLVSRQRDETVVRPSTSVPAAPSVPVVLIGADCATLGAAGVTENGAQAYCARLPSTGDTMWSLYSSEVPTPTVTPGPTDPTFARGIEEQVRVCMQETGKTRLQCREDVRRGNLSGPP